MFKKLETTKLWYNRYLYKIVVESRNHWPAWRFRSASKWLQFDEHPNPDFDSDQSIHFAINKLLREADDYRSRAEGRSVSIFTNDRKLLENISSIAGDRIEEIWEPNPETQHLLKDAYTIVVKEEPSHPIRVMLNDKTISTDFSKWIDANSDKIRIGDDSYRAVKRGWMTGGLYFYLRDDKILSLVNLMISGNIRRIDRLVCER